MSNPAAPQIPEDVERPGPAAPPAPIPDLDGTEGFGPDTHHLRPDDEIGTRPGSDGPRPTPPAIPLDDVDFAPDES